MKYLRKFNEELKSSTYKSAATKLKQFGHVRRSGELEKWSEEVANKEKDARELANLNEFKKEDPFKINLVKGKYNSATKSRDYEIMMSGNFYLKISFDDSWARDSYVDNVDPDGVTEYNYNMPFEIGMMAADDETKEKFRVIEDQLSDEVYEGVYYPQRLYYKLIREAFREITPDGTFYWECRENDEIMFENRAEALRFKKAFVDAVNGRNNFGNSRWCPNLNESLKKFFMGEWIQKYNNDTKSYDKVDRTEIFNEEAFKRFLDSTNRMSVNQLYKN
jgi:hypothetical protein